MSRAAPTVAFPPLALAERIVRLAPGDAATVAIERLGHTAILLLAGGIVAAFLVLGALLPALVRGRLRERSRWAAVSFGASCAVAVLLDPVGPVLVVSLVAVVGAALLYGVVLEWATSAVVTGPADPQAPPSARSSRHERRRAGSRQQLIGRFLFGRAGPEAAGLLVLPDRPLALPSRAVFPAIPGLSPELTAPADHYVVDIDIEDPVVDVGQWTLEVTGLVDEPLSLTLDALQRDFELVEEASVLTCVQSRGWPAGGLLTLDGRASGRRAAAVAAPSDVGGGGASLRGRIRRLRPARTGARVERTAGDRA